MSQPTHLVSIGQGWSLWRDFILRGTGFPVDMLQALGDPQCGPDIEHLLAAAEHAEATARKQAIDEFTRAARHADHANIAEMYRRAVGLVHRGRAVPHEWLVDNAVKHAMERLDGAVQALAHARQKAGHRYARTSMRIGRVLRRIAADPRFREAIAWQNRALLRSALDPLLHTPVEQRTARARSKERIVASYVQRYCAKNDFIGFFGPVAWGTFGDSAGDPITLRPGPDLIADSEVFFEHWAIESLARAMVSIPGLRPYARPRRMPYVRVDGERLHTPEGSMDLDPVQASLLELCDGQRRALDIAAMLLASVPAGMSEDHVYEALAGMADSALIRWTFEIPKVRDRFDTVLRAQIESIDHGEPRQRALAMLDALDEKRADLARALGHPDKVARAMESLEATFETLTGQSSTRRSGQTYAARTLVYLDCSRDVDIHFDTRLRDDLGPPLQLLMQSARWLGARIAAAYSSELMALFCRMRDDRGTERIDLATFWLAAAPMFPRTLGGKRPASVQAVFDDYQARWATILDLPGDASRVQRSADNLAPGVARAFAADMPGWPSARISSPDIQIAAASADAIRARDYQIVLGELHFHCNTLELYAMLRFHPRPEELLRAAQNDYPSGRIAHTAPAEDAARSFLTPLTLHPDDLSIEYQEIPSWRDRDHTTVLSDLEIAEEHGELVVATRDGARRWALLHFIEGLLTEYNPSLLAPRAHTPRLTMDKVVVARETWRIVVKDLPFHGAKTPWERFRAVRRWAGDLGLPALCFYRPSAEVKPSYVDFDSPVFVECFAKNIRASASVTMSEMLPTPDQCWLVDAKGNRYTSELRLAAVDPRPWQPTFARTP